MMFKEYLVLISTIYIVFFLNRLIKHFSYICILLRVRIKYKEYIIYIYLKMQQAD